MRTLRSLERTFTSNPLENLKNEIDGENTLKKFELWNTKKYLCFNIFFSFTNIENLS